MEAKENEKRGVHHYFLRNQSQLDLLLVVQKGLRVGQEWKLRAGRGCRIERMVGLRKACGWN